MDQPIISGKEGDAKTQKCSGSSDGDSSINKNEDTTRRCMICSCLVPSYKFNEGVESYSIYTEDACDDCVVYCHQCCRYYVECGEYKHQDCAYVSEASWDDASLAPKQNSSKN